MPDAGTLGAFVAFIVRDEAGDIIGVDRYGPPGSAARAHAEEHGLPKLLAVSGSTRSLWPAAESIPPATVLDGYLLVGEGAPCAATLLGVGAAAISYPMAGSFWSEWARRLHRAGYRRALVLADADAPGRRGAQVAAVALRDAGVRARAIDLFPSRGDGFDVADELRNYESDDARERLLELLLPFVEEDA